MSNASLRCFLAVFLEADIRHRLVKEIQRLREDADHVKWVDPAHLHVTLKFLGQITQAEVVQLSRAMHDLAGTIPPHRVRVCGLGAFPSIQTPRTIWAGFSDGSEALTKLGQAIEAQCCSLGFKRENRPFTPHVTLGRRKAELPALRLAEQLRQSAEIDYGESSVSEFRIVTSNLRRSGPEYVPIATLPLRGPSDADKR